MKDWDAMTAEDWAMLSSEELEEIEMDELPLMALALRVAEATGFETRQLLGSASGDATDTVEWRGRAGTIPVRYALPGLEMQVQVRADGMLNLWLDKPPGEVGTDWSSDDERYAKVHHRLWTLEHFVPKFRALPLELQHEIAAGMAEHAILMMSFDEDDGIEVQMPFNHFQALTDPVRQISGALRFVGQVAGALVPEPVAKKGDSP